MINKKILIVAGILAFLLVVPARDKSKYDCEYVGVITDIESVSVGGSGGFLGRYTPDKCIIYLNGQKQLKEGVWCSFQIKDKIYSCTFNHLFGLMTNTYECNQPVCGPWWVKLK